MKSKFSSLILNIFKYIRNNIYSRNVGIFLIFLFLSAVFWLLTQLEENYVTTVSYPVKYTNPPPNKVFVGDLPSRLELEIEGNGFKLMEYKIGKEIMPIELNISSSILSPGDEEDKLKYYIPTNSVRSKVTQQLGSSVDILDISPDSLFFEFAEQGEKKVPLKPDLSYELGAQLMLNDRVELTPDSITISGPDKIIDTITSVNTQHENVGVINKDFSFITGLEKVHSRVDYSTEQVRVFIPVERFTEGKLEKEINVKNEPDSVLVRTFPKNVNITYLVGLSNYDKIMPELFKVSVNYSQVKEGKNRLDVSVEKAPEYLKSYSFSPESVDYIIEKKDD
ncbi:MAG: hypothetical protein ACQESJ_06875 [Bacteroidota bacterium]